MDENRKSGWAFWTAAALIMVLVAYPLSFGPACWVASWIPPMQRTVAIAYGPLMRIAWVIPDDGALINALWVWGQTGESEGSMVAYATIILASPHPGNSSTGFYPK